MASLRKAASTQKHQIAKGGKWSIPLFLLFFFFKFRPLSQLSSIRSIVLVYIFLKSVGLGISVLLFQHRNAKSSLWPSVTANIYIPVMPLDPSSTTSLSSCYVPWSTRALVPQPWGTETGAAFWSIYQGSFSHKKTSKNKEVVMKYLSGIRSRHSWGIQNQDLRHAGPPVELYPLNKVHQLAAENSGPYIMYLRRSCF